MFVFSLDLVDLDYVYWLRQEKYFCVYSCILTTVFPPMSKHWQIVG